MQISIIVSPLCATAVKEPVSDTCGSGFHSRPHSKKIVAYGPVIGSRSFVLMIGYGVDAAASPVRQTARSTSPFLEISGAA